MAPIFLSPADDDVSYVTSNSPLEIYGLDGNDTIFGGNNSDFIDGGEGNDTIRDLGGLGSDHFVGGNGNDVLSAVAGADWLEGGSGNDAASGGADNDVLDGGIGNDFLDGEADDDTIFGGTGQDYLIGGTGNDWLYSDGADTLRGDDGNDVYVISGANVQFYATDPGQDRVETGLTFSLAGLDIEDLTLTGGAAINGTGNERANTIIGNDAANVLSGEAGNDLIRGFGGNDTLNAGPADGVEYMYGGTGNDTYVISDGLDTPVELAGEGRDVVQSAMTWTLGANIEDLKLTGSANIGGTGNADANLITGNSNANLIQGAAGLDTLAGGGGNDFYVLGDLTFIDDQNGSEYDNIVEAANGGIDTVRVGNFGNDRYYLDANVEYVEVSGSAGLYVVGNGLANLFTGNTGNNQFYGEAGNDTLNGGAGIDQLYGGAQDDTYFLFDTNDAGPGFGVIYDVVGEAVNEGWDSVFVSKQGLSRYYTDANIEAVYVTGASGLDVIGNGLSNVLTGNGAYNLLAGDAGNDTLDGGFGIDDLVGGTGNDVFILNDTNANGGAGQVYDTVEEDPNGGFDTVYVSWAGFSLYYATANVEALVATGSATLDLIGNGLDNALTGNAAYNYLAGGDGNDTLDGGGPTADDLLGGAGNDTFVNPAGDDVKEFAGGGTDTIQTTATYSIASLADVENIRLTGTADVNAAGNAAANRLLGNAGANVLNGGVGADIMTGGAGNDTYYVDASGDQTIESAGQGTDIVSSSISRTLAVYIENLNLSGTASIDGNGNTQANVINGNDANNVLRGYEGSDTLNGKAGLDILLGGLASDRLNPGSDAVRDIIRFSAVGDSTGSQRDIVTGLDLAAEDKLDFTVVPVSIGAQVHAGVLNLATINADLAAAVNANLAVNGAVLFDPSSGNLNLAGHVFLVVDGNGDGVYTPNQDYVVELVNHTGTLTLDDFM